MKLRLIAGSVTLAVALGACGGGSGGAVAPSGDHQRSTVGPVVPSVAVPPAFIAIPGGCPTSVLVRGHSHLLCPSFPKPIPANWPLTQIPHGPPSQTIPNSPPWFGPPPIGSPQSRGRSSVVTSDGGGQLGFHYASAGKVVTMVVNHTYLDPSQFVLGDPGYDANNKPLSTVLYAPTSKMSGGCYEVGSDYWRNGGDVQTTGTFRTYNFCYPSGGNPGTFDYSYDLTYGDNFEQSFVYTGTAEDGVQRDYYSVEVALMSDNRYHVMLYNAHPAPAGGSIGWTEIISSDMPTAPRTDYWSMFEMKLTSGQTCPGEPAVESNEYQMQQTAGGPFTFANYANNTPLFAGSCTFDDGSQNGYFYTQVTGTPYWIVKTNASL